MLKLIGGRLLALVPLLFLVSLISVFLIQLVPGDPAETIAGSSATDAQIAQVRSQLGLDVSAPLQYWNWITHAVQGDFGRSLLDGSEVLPVVTQRFGVTFTLAVAGILVGVLIGVPAGSFAALRPGSLVDRGIMILATAGLAMPAFWLALLLVAFFGMRLGWFPATGYSPPELGIGPWLSSLVLPALALGAVVAAMLARHARSSMIETLQKPYIRTARAMGLRRSSVIGKHALKNSCGPVLTTMGFHFAHLLGGAVVVEQVFGIHGLGGLALEAVNTRDMPVIQCVVVVTGLAVAAAQLLVDLGYGLVNPKVRPQ
ncbi:ABC transporter permease [Nocardioides alcanivorans]|uniref:ABC transporter permease n=1 Tax=Nocardioides alcanivorans TaxID=2897352 RepID=UPI001F21FB1B|nr:ABC transporter permease [Nocardioides alcanivorans]